MLNDFMACYNYYLLFEGKNFVTITDFLKMSVVHFMGVLRLWQGYVLR